MREESLLSTTFPTPECREYCNGFRIGGVSVRMSGDCGFDVALGPLLEPFRFSSDSPDIDVRVDWLHALATRPGSQLFDSGSTWQLSIEDDGYRFDFNAPFLGERPYRRLLIDFSFKQAVLQMSRECFAVATNQADPLEYPLDELLIMHRLTQERAIELHGSGIVRANGDANLFLGHSGAGKSTTTRLWTEFENVEVLSDDRIIVRRDENASAAGAPCDAPGSASKHGILRHRDCSAGRTNLSAEDDKKAKMRMYGTPWHGEAMFASPDSAPLTRIFVLEHGHGNVITSLSPGQAVAELFARSFVPFHRHEYVDSALEFLQELVDAVPVYRYAFEPDRRAVEKIRNFHD